VDPELDEGPGVDQQIQSLARGELVTRVLGGDLLLAPAELDLLAPRAQVLGERAQQAGGRGVGGQASGAARSRK
jgi:hypothetical protein